MYLYKNDWRVKEIPKSQASEFIEQYHYGKGTANTRVACHGLFYKGDNITLHGASWWMPPPLGAAKYISQQHSGVLSLSRFCLIPGRPDNAGSYLIGKSIKMLNNKRWHTLLTFADTALNHKGILYKASNWTYAGLTTKQPLFVDNDGKMVSRKKGPKTYTKNQMIEMGYNFVGMFSKHRFVYPINRRIIYPSAPQQLELSFTDDGKINEKNNQ